MSTAMRSTLQTVPESLEVTKPTTNTQEAPLNVSLAKTPSSSVKSSAGDAVSTKTSRPYNYSNSSTNKPIKIKDQMMKILRRSKSSASAHSTEKTPSKTHQHHQHHHHHHHYNHHHVVHPQQPSNRNSSGGMVVNMIEGVPVVVGPGIGKIKKVVFLFLIFLIC